MPFLLFRDDLNMFSSWVTEGYIAFSLQISSSTLSPSWPKKRPFPSHGSLYHHSLPKETLVWTTNCKYDQEYGTPCARTTVEHSTLGRWRIIVFFLSLSLTVLHNNLSFCLSVCLSAYLSFCLSISLSPYLFVYVFFDISFGQSINLSIYQSIRLSVVLIKTFVCGDILSIWNVYVLFSWFLSIFRSLLIYFAVSGTRNDRKKWRLLERSVSDKHRPKNGSRTRKSSPSSPTEAWSPR